jgi:Ser/Thr protein kinase RdoA (MazF antagonist)
MFRRVVPAVLDAYGVTDYLIGAVQKGYRNESYPIKLSDGTSANLIFFKRESDIVQRMKRADEVAARAHSAGLPVRTRYDQRVLHVADGRYAGLYTYLPGATVSWEAMTMKHIKLLGQAMGDLHAALKDEQSIDGYKIAGELLSLNERMQLYFTKPEVVAAMRDKLSVTMEETLFDSFRSLLEHVAAMPGQQLLHMDMVRGNVLFAEAGPTDKWQIDTIALSGVIDFEKAGIGHPILDIARTLAFLLVDSKKPASKIQRYFLDSGYHKRGEQPLPSPQLLPLLVRFFMLHDFYKFLRHTPYESLRHNYHYTRTHDLLKTYGIIR